jgi:glycosyltransferase involved in cell wall biosynthesis
MQQGDARALLHIHWEEHLLRAMPTLQEARIAAGHFTRQLARYRSGGGKTIWTIHNAAPHELEHLEVFQSVRSVLADAADRILVHTVDAVGVLAEQVALDRSKVFYLPHPSYLGIYEPVAQLEESLRRAPGRSVITFGKLRRYKGLERLLDELPPEFLRELGSSLEIRGEPLASYRPAPPGATTCCGTRAGSGTRKCRGCCGRPDAS